MNRADTALYEAKHRGRNSVCVSARSSQGSCPDEEARGTAQSPQSTLEAEAAERAPLPRESDEQKTIEEYLRESEERHRELVESLNVGVYVTTTGPEGRFLQANTANAKLLGQGEVDLRSDRGHHRQGAAWSGAEGRQRGAPRQG